MAIAQYGKVKKFARNDLVEIHVREVTLLPDTDDTRPYLEIREYITNGEVYGNGILIPVGLIPAITDALSAFTSDTGQSR